MKNIQLIQNKKINYDLLAVLAGLFLTLYFLITAKLSVGLPDEATYLTIPLRLLKGDRLFIDEWNLPQLASLFSLLPLKFYIDLTGGTDGCLLFMRYVFISVNTAYYAFLYYKLRQYKFAAVCAALLFCGIIPQTNFSLTYFTVAPMAVMTVCIILFIGKPVKNRGVLFLMGIIFALGVVAEPFLLALYVIYGVGFLARKIMFRKQTKPSVYAYLFDNRTFFWMTLGAFVMFILFMGYLLYAGILPQLPSMLPYLFSGAEYNASNLTSTVKINDVIYVYGKINLAAIAVCVAASLICRFHFNNPFRMRLVIFIFSLLLLSICYLYCGYRILNGAYTLGLVYHEVPMLFFPLIWYLLCKEKNDRIFIIWLIGFSASLLIDYSSDVMIGSCGRVTQTVGLFSLVSLIKEMREDPPPSTKRRNPLKHRFLKLSSFQRTAILKKMRNVAVIIGIVMISSWNLFYFIAEGLYKPIEKYFVKNNNSFSTELTEGPCKNLVTTAEIADRYYASLRDLDVIKNEANKNDSLYIIKLWPHLYLYANMPFGTFSAWDEDDFDRHISYWTLLPEKRPTYIYVYKYRTYNFNTRGEESIQSEINHIKEVAYCDITEGEAGFIIKIKSWHLLDYQEKDRK